MIAQRPLKQAVWSEKKCDICSSSDFEHLGNRSYILPTKKYRFEMKMSYALCQGCSFILAKEIPDEDFLNLYYLVNFGIVKMNSLNYS